MIEARAQGKSGASKDTKLRPGGLQLPAVEVAAAALAIVPSVGSVADPLVEMYRQEDHLVHKQFMPPDEQGYAVQYCKVRFKCYSSRDLDCAAPEKGSR